MTKATTQEIEHFHIYCRAQVFEAAVVRHGFEKYREYIIWQQPGNQGSLTGAIDVRFPENLQDIYYSTGVFEDALPDTDGRFRALLTDYVADWKKLLAQLEETGEIPQYPA